jgi:hypothetical protein
VLLPSQRLKLRRVRDIETIDGELRLVARAWRLARDLGCRPSTVHIDELLDERSAATSSGLTRTSCWDSCASPETAAAVLISLLACSRT